MLPTPITAPKAPASEGIPLPQTPRGRRPRRLRFGYLGRRLAFYAVAAWAAITMNFLIPRFMPGSPVDALVERLSRAGIAPSAEQIASLEKLLGGSDGSLFEQYLGYLGQLARGDLGISTWRFPVPVSELIANALPWTLFLTGTATALAFLIGIGLGVIAGWRAGSRLDAVLTPLSTFLSSVPYFWIALLALMFLGVRLGWFPVSGGYDPDLPVGSPEYLLSVLHYGFLPIATIVFSSAGGWLLGMRNMMITTTSEDFVLLGKAKGLPLRRVVTRYAARNAMLPSLTGFAIALGGVVAGALLTETVFTYPGIGYLLYQGVQNRDYPLMQGVFLMVTLCTLAANFIADSLYVVLDPRTREGN